MSFWRDHMPAKMLLRSDTDWHLDPLGKHTIDAYLESIGRTPEQVRPLSRQTYLDYTHWFQEQKVIQPRPQRITSLRREGSRFVTEAGDVVYEAGNVVLAIGFECFKNLPLDLCAKLPAGRYGHTCDVVEFDPSPASTS